MPFFYPLLLLSVVICSEFIIYLVNFDVKINKREGYRGKGSVERKETLHTLITLKTDTVSVCVLLLVAGQQFTHGHVSGSDIGMILSETAVVSEHKAGSSVLQHPLGASEEPCTHTQSDMFGI